MAFPAYFEQIPPITLHDPLAELLGAAEGGLIEYHFADAVKLAGHACPTVAAAWLMSRHALRTLYGEDTPVRGQIAVALGEPQNSGVAGVMASIATLLTGAAGEGGFKGLGGQHGRRDLLQFGVQGASTLSFTRLDTNLAVDCEIRLNSVPPDPRLMDLLTQVVRGQADSAARQLFRTLWQDRVRRILVAHADNPALVSCRQRPDVAS